MIRILVKNDTTPQPHLHLVKTSTHTLTAPLLRLAPHHLRGCASLSQSIAQSHAQSHAQSRDFRHITESVRHCFIITASSHVCDVGPWRSACRHGHGMLNDGNACLSIIDTVPCRHRVPLSVRRLQRAVRLSRRRALDITSINDITSGFIESKAMAHHIAGHHNAITPGAMQSKVTNQYWSVYCHSK